MNNQEAAKALLEGKTLRRIEVPYFTYKFNFLNLSIDSTSGQEVTMSSFPDNATWEEVKEPYKKEFNIERFGKNYGHSINGNLGAPLISLFPKSNENKKYKVTVEEIE